MNTKQRYTAEQNLLKQIINTNDRSLVYKLMKMLNGDLSYRRRGSIGHTYKFIKALRALSDDSVNGGDDSRIFGTPFTQFIYKKSDLLQSLKKDIENDKKELENSEQIAKGVETLKTKLRSSLDNIFMLSNSTVGAEFDLINYKLNNILDLNKCEKIKHVKRERLELDRRTLKVIKALDIDYYNFEMNVNGEGVRVARKKVDYHKLINFDGMSKQQAKRAAYNNHFMIKYNIDYHPVTFKEARRPFHDWYTFSRLNNCNIFD